MLKKKVFVPCDIKISTYSDNVIVCSGGFEIGFGLNVDNEFWGTGL